MRIGTKVQRAYFADETNVQDLLIVHSRTSEINYSNIEPQGFIIYNVKVIHNIWSTIRSNVMRFFNLRLKITVRRVILQAVLYHRFQYSIHQ